MEYDVIQDADLRRFVERVNERTAEGWDVLGRLQVKRDKTGWLYIRELVRYKKRYAPGDSVNVWMMEPSEVAGMQ